MAFYISVDQNGFIFGTHSIVNEWEVQQQVSDLGAYAMIEVDPSILELGCVPSGKYYFNGRAIVPRPKYVVESKHEIKADGIDTLVLNKLPIGLTYIYRGQGEVISSMVEDKKIEFSTTQPGYYTILLMPEYPSLYQTQLIEVTASD